MRQGVGAVVLAAVCLASAQHDLANAGGKWFQRGCAAPYGCAMPYGCGAPACAMPIGCAAPVCSAPLCAGPACGMPACHGPFAPLVAHYYRGCAAPGCFGCGGCAAPTCGAPLMGCAAPTCALPLGADGVPLETSYVPQSTMMYDGIPSVPLMSGLPVPDYYAPQSPLAAPIPAVPPAEDIVW